MDNHLKAEELFNRLGFLVFNYKKDERYSLYNDEDVAIVYFNKEIKVYIWFFNKQKHIDFSHPDCCVRHFKLSNNLIKAINKQITELELEEDLLND